MFKSYIYVFYERGDDLQRALGKPTGNVVGSQICVLWKNNFGKMGFQFVAPNLFKPVLNNQKQFCITGIIWKPVFGIFQVHFSHTF